jgi:CO/xanthine dehydrogenase FAD-binding subunit
MTTTLTRTDGLYISTHTPWPQLASDQTLCEFANGLIPMTLEYEDTSWTLSELLHHTGSQTYPLLTVLLILDAEINAVVEDKQPVFPLPGFLTYRSKLSPEKFPLDAIRLPLLNGGGHYFLTLANDGFCAAIRLDLHPQRKLAGHVRIAISSPTRTPIRLRNLEHRLERQILTKELIQVAILAINQNLPKPLSKDEQIHLNKVLQGLI